MDLQSFLKTKGEVYEKFTNNEEVVKKAGIKLDPALEKEVGAHVVVGLYSRETLPK